MGKTKKTVLITGADGMLGQDLVKSIKGKFEVVGLKRESCDITDKKKVIEVFKRYRPWAVIHSASFTDVDGCERDKKRAYCVNAQGTYNVVKAAERTGAILFYLSSDYVFSGRKLRPYREKDKTHPLSVYGKTKSEGEDAVRKLLKKHIIIRTSWLFGEGRSNFIDKVLSWAKNKKSLNIVADKYSNPTYSKDLAKAILRLLEMMHCGTWKDSFYGIYHIVNSGYCSWYEYAQYILKVKKVKVKVKPIRITEMNFRARRPPFSALDNSKYIKTFGLHLRPWQEAVKEYITHHQNDTYAV